MTASPTTNQSNAPTTPRRPRPPRPPRIPDPRPPPTTTTTTTPLNWKQKFPNPAPASEPFHQFCAFLFESLPTRENNHNEQVKAAQGTISPLCRPPHHTPPPLQPPPRTHPPPGSRQKHAHAGPAAVQASLIPSFWGRNGYGPSCPKEDSLPAKDSHPGKPRVGADQAGE